MRKSQYFPLNVECLTREQLVPPFYVFGMTRFNTNTSSTFGNKYLYNTCESDIVVWLWEWKQKEIIVNYTTTRLLLTTATLAYGEINLNVELSAWTIALRFTGTIYYGAWNEKYSVDIESGTLFCTDVFSSFVICNRLAVK